MPTTHPANSLPNEPTAQQVAAFAEQQLLDVKAKDITLIDVKDKSNFTDIMVVATGTSNRHVVACASNVRDECKKAGHPALGMEGEDAGEWVLVDLGDVIVHVMQQETRDLYQLEKLWSVEPNRGDADAAQ